MVWLDGQLWDQVFLKFVLDVSLKSSAILLVAGVAALLLHRSSAAVRHWLWSFSIFCVLLLPLLSSVLPGWQVPLIPESLSAVIWPAAEAETGDVLVQPDLGQSPVENGDLTRSSENSLAVPPRPQQTVSDSNQEWQRRTVGVPAILGVGNMGSEPERRTLAPPLAFDGFSWSYLVFGIWLAGVGLVLGRLLLGMSWVRWMSRTARQVKEPDWTALLTECRQYLGILRPVALWQGFHATTPMTWGVFRPVVLLPLEAEGWSRQLRRVVLMHELAHIKRHDMFTQMLAQLALAFFWFNPLMWCAVRQLRVEREHACDDHVLTAGAGASEYAKHLLDIARNLRPAQVASLSTIAMARRSQLEGRLLAILNPKQNRRSLTPLTAIFLMITLAAVVVPLAAVQPWSPVSAAAPHRAQTSSVTEAPVKGAAQKPTGDDLSGSLEDQVQQGFQAVVERIDSIRAQGSAADTDQQLEALIEAAERLLALTTERLKALARQLASGDEDVVDQVKTNLQQLSKDYRDVTGQLEAAFEALDARTLGKDEVAALESRLHMALEDDIEALSDAAVGVVDSINVWVKRTLNDHGLAADENLGAFITGLTQKITIEVQIEMAREIRNLFGNIRFFKQHAGQRVIVIGDKNILIQTGPRDGQALDGDVDISITINDVRQELFSLRHVLDDTLDEFLKDLDGALEDGLDELDGWLKRVLKDG